MSGAEIVSWQIGVDCRQRGVSISRFLIGPEWLKVRGLSPEQLAARTRLGNDQWSYWVRRGYDDATSTQQRTR